MLPRQGARNTRDSYQLDAKAEIDLEPPLAG
jgi:hypothetical protein